MTPEEILKKNFGSGNPNDFVDYYTIISCIEEYGKQQWNEAIKLAAEEAKAKNSEERTYPYSGMPGVYKDTKKLIVNKQSILKLLK